MNPIMFAKVILASKPTNGALPLITMHWRYPRIIHPEVMTHRVLSRNARSSRAVPVATMLKEIRDAPFVPWHWGKNQKGMQASEENEAHVGIRNAYLDYDEENSFGRTHDFVSREGAWRAAALSAADFAEQFAVSGYHKQVVNRLIEPFSYIDTLVTSTSWANFRHLRDHKDAEPHFQDLAKMIGDAIDNAEYQDLMPGEWHLPYIDADDWGAADCFYHELMRSNRPVPVGGNTSIVKRLSVARCARISYAPFDGDGSIEKELERYDLLVGSDPLHASPTEHQATPDIGHVVAFTEGKKRVYDNPDFSGNFCPGWIQYRKTLAGEYVQDVQVSA